MSDEQREKGVEELRAMETSKTRHSDEEPEVEGHLFTTGSPEVRTERKRDKVERKLSH
jgi:hypothetical protein